MLVVDYQEIKNWQKISQLQQLLDLSTPPKKLYFQGNLNPKIFENCVAIVGSRRMTSYGERAIEKIVPQFVQTGKTIVSGFMYGIDQCAHRVCVEGGGLTIAVLGWGIDKKLTGEDLKLAKGIIDTGGILLSEWEVQEPTHWTFPARNRIVAALSQEVIVVEAAEKSGSLITARLANKLKRTLWAVPGPITSRTSAGTNNLIAGGLAKMWLGTSTQTPIFNTDDPIMEILLNETQTADELARNLQLPVSEIGARLSILLLSGQVIEKDGKYYIADVN
ncbi:MAG: DNA-processing protein DprA [Patescibacteria group bacterium]